MTTKMMMAMTDEDAHGDDGDEKVKMEPCKRAHDDEDDDGDDR